MHDAMVCVHGISVICTRYMIVHNFTHANQHDKLFLDMQPKHAHTHFLAFVYHQLKLIDS